jgi:hypothetical protein
MIDCIQRIEMVRFHHLTKRADAMHALLKLAKEANCMTVARFNTQRWVAFPDSPAVEIEEDFFQ